MNKQSLICEEGEKSHAEFLWGLEKLEHAYCTMVEIKAFLFNDTNFRHQGKAFI